jgi:hypothetical protein
MNKGEPRKKSRPPGGGQPFSVKPLEPFPLGNDDSRTIFNTLVLAGDSVGGTYINTGAAIGAFISINDVDIPFRNSLYGTFGNTSSASNTITGNSVSHHGLL